MLKLYPCKEKMRELVNTSVSYLCEPKLSVKATLLESPDTEKKMVAVRILWAETLVAFIEVEFVNFMKGIHFMLIIILKRPWTTYFLLLQLYKGMFCNRSHLKLPNNILERYLRKSPFE